jgi:hypothetical protein
MFSCQLVLPARRSFASSHDPQTQFRLAQPSAHVKNVACSGTRPQPGAPGRHFPHDGHIDKNLISPRGVSACQHTLKLPRCTLQPPEEPIQPPAGVRLWQGQAQQEAAGRAPHCRDIADRSRQTFPTDRIWRMPLSQEVRSFQEPVAGENRFVPGLWPEERRVIANSKSDGMPSSWDLG